MRTFTGVMAISLYFLDIISDVQVRHATLVSDHPTLIRIDRTNHPHLASGPPLPCGPQVIQLLWSTENWTWAWMSIFLLVAQFFVVYLRVIPYLSSTFGSDSAIYLVFLWLGFPTGHGWS